MEWGLILTVCVALAGGNEKCDDYLIDVLPSYQECATALSNQTGTPSDRYHSCAPVTPENHKPGGLARVSLGQ